ncbi:predicted protein, partial [Nematostella vectensis]
NILTILTFVRNKRKKRKKSVYCLMNLALSDLSVGILTIPLYVSYLAEAVIKGNSSDTMLALSVDVIYQFTASAANFSLVLVSLERLYVTLYPLQHRKTRTRSYLISIALTWLIALGITLIYYVFKYELKAPKAIFYVLLPVLLVSLVLICLSYAVILVKIRRRNGSCLAMIAKGQRQERKLAHTLCIVTATSLATWLPFTIMQIMSIKGTSAMSSDTVFSVLLIQCSNSLVNPIIYALRIREFRNTLLQLLRCKSS